MTSESKKLSSLHADERGAMMLISVFMAMIAVAMLYYVAAIGESVAYRERLQDGVDSTAYVGAVVMARSMNIVVIMNLAIASIFASAVITQTVFWTMVAAQPIAAAACYPGMQASGCVAAVCLFVDQAQACSDNSDVEDEVSDAVEAAHRVQERLESYARIISVAASVETASTFGEPVATGLAVGENLPIRDDTRAGIMCEHTLGSYISPRSLVIAGLAQIQAQEIIACNQNSTYVAAGAISSAALPLYCRLSHSSVDPVAARLESGVNQGDDEFQFYAGVTGSTPPISENDTRVGVARWGNTGSSVVDDLGLRNLARVSIAQAEYYHGSTESNDDIMWSVQWRARLRRFNAPTGSSVCSVAGDLCGALSAAVVH